MMIPGSASSSNHALIGTEFSHCSKFRRHVTYLLASLPRHICLGRVIYSSSRGSTSHSFGLPLRSRSWIPAGGFYIFKMVSRENSFMWTGRVCHMCVVPGHIFNNFRLPIIPRAILRSNSSSSTIFHPRGWFRIDPG